MLNTIAPGETIEVTETVRLPSGVLCCFVTRDDTQEGWVSATTDGGTPLLLLGTAMEREDCV